MQEALHHIHTHHDAHCAASEYNVADPNLSQKYKKRWLVVLLNLILLTIIKLVKVPPVESSPDFTVKPKKTWDNCE